MYRHVPDCIDCKAMANLTNTHLAEINVEESNEMDIYHNYNIRTNLIFSVAAPQPVMFHYILFLLALI